MFRSLIPYPRAISSLSTRQRITISAAALLLLAAFAPATIGTANPQRYQADVTALAAPQMEGRGAGTKGLARAAKMLEVRYKSLGLKPAGTNGFLQPFSVITGAKLKGNNHFVVHNGSTKTELTMNQDFVPFSFSESGVANSEIVFAGYGATAEEFQYDDYAGIDVKDKIVVVLRYEPPSFAAKGGNHGLT